MKRKMQKIMALLLSVVLVIGLLPICNQTVNAETLSEIPEGYTPIYTFEDLYNIRSNTSGNYILMNDIDLSETAEGGKYDSGTGWSIILEFSGVFDGNGYSINGLNIYGLKKESYVGFFGEISSTGIVKNLNINNININTGSTVTLGTGGIAGNNEGVISDCIVSGVISTEDYNYIGGIVGVNRGSITNCDVSATIECTNTGRGFVGGIAGIVEGTSSLKRCSVEGTITGQNVGGICGNSSCFSADILECYSIATVNATGTSCYAGGILGYIDAGSVIIQDSYSGGYVMSDWVKGGIVGYTKLVVQIKNCYSKLEASIIAGYYSYSYPVVENCYYLYDSNSTTSNGKSLSNWQMNLQSSFAGFDFDSVWTISEGNSSPQLINNLEDVVENVSLYSVPTKIKYYQGEEFSVDGAKMNLVISNKSYSVIVPITSDMVTGVDTSIVGEQTATVTYKGFTVQFPITVLPILAESIELTTNTLSVDVGNTYTLNATITPENTTDKTITWATSDEAIATVEDGIVKGIKPGTVKITATTNNNKTAVCTVTVLQPASSIALNATELSIDKGKTSTITTTLTPSDSTDKVTYSSNNKSVCTVDEKGIVTAVAVGEAVITVSTSRGLSKFCTVTVTQSSESIALNKDNAEIVVNNSFVLSATMLPSDTTDTVKWTSSNDSICTVSENGVVTGISKGIAVITATSTSGKTASCTVIVKAHAGGHTVVIDKAVSPTCTETGITEGSHCSDCDEVIIEQQIIPATGHTVVIDEKITPTCTETGLTEGSHCSVCGEIIEKQKEISATGHNVVVDEAVLPTCTKTGLTEGSHCSTCGEIIIEQTEIEKIEHKYVETVVSPTCTEQGYTVHECSVCGDSYNDAYTNATGHSYGEWTTTKSATCTAEGEQTRECSVCEETETKVIKKIAHKYEDTIIAPTCTEKGYTNHMCGTCGDSYNDAYTNATGHSYGEWTTTKSATCKAEGEQIRECSVCEETETKVIKKIAHKYVDTIVAPTCTEKGYTKHECSVCGDSYNDTYTSATGHSYTDWLIIKPATCTSEGEKTRECVECGDKETKTINKISHKYADTIVLPTCTEKGYTIHMCGTCGDSYNDTYTSATGHSYGEWTTTKSATCKAEGEQIRECSVCEETETKVINIIAHSYVDTIVESTYTEQGYTVHECSVCKDSYKDSYVPVKAPINNTNTDNTNTDNTNTENTNTNYTNTNSTNVNSTNGTNTVTTDSTKPTKVKFKLKAGKKKVTVKWNKVKGADGYTIYYKTAKKGSWKKLKNVSAKKTKYVKKKLKSGKKYYFTVKAYKKVNGKKVYGKGTTKKVKVK